MRLGLIAAALLASVTFASSAAASSIVFIKGGNVWLASPDGSKQVQVTTGGSWDSASQADDGTILAQQGTQLYRLNRQGTLLVPAIDTSLTGAPPTWAGPVDPVISPDGVNQAYDGEITDSGVYDPTCGCYDYTHTFTTWWGSATQFSQPNQTLGQEDYVDPTWIDSGHLLLSSAGILIAQVATYAIGGGDNSMIQWFSDPDTTVQGLDQGAITRAGDKLAFVANVQGGVGNEIRIYTANGPPPVPGGPVSSPPTDTCNIGPTGFQSLRVSFSPDGQSLAYDAPDGIHLVSVAGLPSCAGLNDQLIIPGGSLPYFGPTDVGPSDGIQSGPPPPPPPSNAFTISKSSVRANGTITLTLSAPAAGSFTAQASFTATGKHHLHSHVSYGSATAPKAGALKLVITPSAKARRALNTGTHIRVQIAVKFTPTGGVAKVENTSATVVVHHPRSRHH